MALARASGFLCVSCRRHLFHAATHATSSSHAINAVRAHTSGLGLGLTPTQPLRRVWRNEETWGWKNSPHHQAAPTRRLCDRETRGPPCRNGSMSDCRGFRCISRCHKRRATERAAPGAGDAVAWPPQGGNGGSTAPPPARVCCLLRWSVAVHADRYPGKVTWSEFPPKAPPQDGFFFREELLRSAADLKHSGQARSVRKLA